MNRIQPRKPAAKPMSPLSKPAAIPQPAAAVAAVLSRAEPDQPPHTLFAPLHYERNYAYPLIVWLHGPDDNESQLKRIMPSVSLRNYVAIAPRGTAASAARAGLPSSAAASMSAGGPAAGPAGQAAPAAFHWRQTEEHIEAAEQRVLDCLAAAGEKFHIAAGRTFLAGYGCGGTMALRVALRQPRHFAGVLSFGGGFPTGHAPLAHLAQLRRLSIFVACNRASQRYPSAVVCDDLRLLHSAGMSIVLREYPGPDGLTPQMLSDMDRWLMEQITGGDAARASESTPSQSGPR